MARPDTDLIHMRESHMVTCPGCGFIWDEWDSGISLEDAATQIASGAVAVDALLTRPCPRCGYAMEWDAVIVPDSDRGTLTPSQQRRLAGTFRRLIREGASAATIVETVRRMYGVTAFYARQAPERHR